MEEGTWISRDELAWLAGLREIASSIADEMRELDDDLASIDRGIAIRAEAATRSYGKGAFAHELARFVAARARRLLLH